jgi:tyrosyl-tRNA synthetase
LDFEQLAELASNFTVQQMLERDMFERRLKEGKPLFVHEFFYPLMQGYDSVAMDVDMEIGGTDQTFNMLAGRILVKRYQNREKFVISTTLLENPKTGEKLMSKSQGTGVGLDLPPNEMYAKVMALPDEGLEQCFIDCTRLPMGEIESIKRQLASGTNPRDIKMRLAREIVAIYHDEAMAKSAEQAFVSQFSEHELPSDILDVKLARSDWAIDDLLVETGLSESKSAARRLLKQRGVKINQQKITANTVTINSGDVLQVGKRQFVRITIVK